MKIEAFCKPDEQMAKLGRQHWSVSRLFTLIKDLPVMDVPLEHMYMYYTYNKLSLREMVGHIKSVNNADLKYPVILDEDGEMMDGRHRLMKALLENKKTIKVVRFEVNPSPCRQDEDD